MALSLASCRTGREQVTFLIPLLCRLNGVIHIKCLSQSLTQSSCSNGSSHHSVRESKSGPILPYQLIEQYKQHTQSAGKLAFYTGSLQKKKTFPFEWELWRKPQFTKPDLQSKREGFSCGWASFRWSRLYFLTR